ncbi:alpha,alpha-trehalose-phosphate synthase [Cyanidioschyzon merolae strain 10D]|uniref:alpha,alpha-trehalose-phosphate synthase (UDP-forming) n=1 Tax=Cyanidioschyzon merolae (strain NIES-3377 / 10D) TaxID=280699 RepID=M1V9E3_CYAM1|nr:alpha,alpha-trehalose-phosphate synthase [Cyanidioschyzon merolae strain 10D]BAM81439.1 alpha,alpha-trehalose-phosphate synthase [Cyanidioschyzon merolae strain 10D]|eukprot:XP_005537475.1 alpha,alpha-trehalose-phosphate synthase [Cyanidioschyzon merolae strain 10D]
MRLYRFVLVRLLVLALVVATWSARTVKKARALYQLCIVLAVQVLNWSFCTKIRLRDGASSRSNCSSFASAEQVQRISLEFFLVTFPGPMNANNQSSDSVEDVEEVVDFSSTDFELEDSSAGQSGAGSYTDVTAALYGRQIGGENPYRSTGAAYRRSHARSHAVEQSSPLAGASVSPNHVTEDELLSRIQELQFQLMDLRESGNPPSGTNRTPLNLGTPAESTPVAGELQQTGVTGSDDAASAALSRTISLPASAATQTVRETIAEGPSQFSQASGSPADTESSAIQAFGGSDGTAAALDAAGTQARASTEHTGSWRVSRRAASLPRNTRTDMHSEMQSEDESKPKLIIVSNRLPITMKRRNDGQYDYTMSSGGLVSALEGALDPRELPFIWVGWPGGEVDPADETQVSTELLHRYGLVPVFLSAELHELYYNGFCNDVLWPLFHYVPLQVVSQDGERKFDYKYWAAYTTANQRFAEAIMSVYRRGDSVWVQDYHLMLLPALLRRKLRHSTRIGFFLHTPFPSSEVYRILPVRREILEGVLAADLIGFHTFDYARHFLSVCTRILGLESSHKGVAFHGHFARVGIFPIGIDPNLFLRTMELALVKARIEELRNRFRGQKILIGVDRLDYIKGVPHKLLAFETLLKKYPEWHEKVVLAQIAVPSRIEVEEYRKLIAYTNELVGRINGRFGSVEYAPIMFINQSIPFEELCALYHVADVAVITSIRDGMNLVSYEYVMCQREKCGVLILSEFAGSAQSLSGAIRVNPWNIEELAAAMHEALTMSDREREMKHWKLYRYVTTHTASYWAQSFVSELQQLRSTQQQQQQPDSQQLLTVPEFMQQVARAQHRLFILGYEGSIQEQQSVPELAAPSQMLWRLLMRLCSDGNNRVYLMSSRDRSHLMSWFEEVRAGGERSANATLLSMGLIAEDGQFYRHPGRLTEWKVTTSATEANASETELKWKHEILPILNYYTERTPGSFLEIKERSISWHYRDADPDYGVWQARELQAHLVDYCTTMPMEVIHQGGSAKRIDFRASGGSRAAAVARVLQDLGSSWHLVFCLAADTRDDNEVYTLLRGYRRDTGDRIAWTCSVGSGVVTAGSSAPTSAEFFLPDIGHARHVLREIVGLTVTSSKSRSRETERRRRSGSGTQILAAD